MTDAPVFSFADAFGPLGDEAPAFIGRILFADFVEAGQQIKIRDEDENPNSVIVVWYYGQWGLFPATGLYTFDALTRTYTLGNALGGRYFFIAGCFY